MPSPRPAVATNVRHFAINADDVARVVANGGQILIPKTLIPTVGHLIFFRDTEGNCVGAMQYDAHAGRPDDS